MVKNGKLTRQGEGFVNPNKPSVIGGSLPVDDAPSDNSKITRFLLEVYSWPKIDTTNPEEVMGRWVEYLEHCDNYGMRPTNQAAYFAIGILAEDVSLIERGLKGSPTMTQAIKNIKAYLAGYREILGVEGRLYPAALIWWQKNYDGLRDTQEIIITPSNPLGDGASAEDIRKRLSGSVI